MGLIVFLKVIGTERDDSVSLTRPTNGAEISAPFLFFEKEIMGEEFADLP